jgi:DNA-binding beta-propeller fold protein YncE
MLVDRLGPRDLAAVVFPMSQDAGQDFTTDVDMTLMKVVKKLPTEAKPDGSTYAAPFHKLYVTDERGAIAVFQMDDADHYRKLEGFPVEKRVHTLAIDQATSRVYAPEQEEAGKPVARMVVYDAVVKR